MCSKDGSIVVKYVKAGVYVIIYYNVVWGVYRGVGNWFFRGVGGEVNMSKV